MRVRIDSRSGLAGLASLASLAGVASLVSALACAGCDLSAEVVERPVTVHVPRSCAIDPTQAYSLFYAGGDFSPEGGTPFQGVFLRDQGSTLQLPDATRSLVADVSQGADVRSWRGLSLVPPTGPVNILAWPQDEACRLTLDVERRVDATVASLDSRRVIVVGGRSASSTSVPRTYVADMTTGDVVPLRFGVGSRRGGPTVTQFPGGALVSGGVDPDSGAPLGTAEVYKDGPSGALGDFDQARIDLAEPRGRHGAVTLLSGETLLVGGEGLRGALRTMEIIDPVARRSRTQGVALLQVARKSPTVLRLTSGEILVAGGFDDANKPVATLEWFAPDGASPTKRARDLVATPRRAFVALPAGGALAVVAPANDATGFQSVWIITGDGALEPAIPAVGLYDVQLFPGPEGSPLLWTGARWLRYEPWFGAFAPIADAPGFGPPGVGAVSPDSGLVLWLRDDGDSGMHLWGYRHGVRNPFQSVAGELLTDGPRYFAPDRVPGESARYDPQRGLTLEPTAQAILTDLTFARVAVDVEGPTGAVPWVVLRQESGPELVVGGPDCPLLTGSRIHVERVRDKVTASVDSAPASTCVKPLEKDARVMIGLRGGATKSFTKRVTVTRRVGD